MVWRTMKSVCGWMWLAVPLLAGCATAPPPSGNPATLPAVTDYGQAVAMLSGMGPVTGESAWAFLTRTAPPDITGDDVTLHFREGKRVCRYTQNPDPQVRKRALASPPTSFDLFCQGGKLSIWGSAELNAQRVAALKFMATAGGESAPERDAFIAAREAYRAGGVGPELPEPARMFKVQAEAAVRENRLWDAAAAFERGLSVAPWWPQGNFNLAQIYGSLKAYTPAIRYMQRYLELVPEAANARQAQDKIYEWMASAERKP